MATVYKLENLSTAIVQNQFRAPIQSYADDSNEPLTDPEAAERDPNDNTIPPFVLPSFPDQDPLYPHVIVSEAGWSENHPDARAAITEGEYDVRIRVHAKSTTQRNKILDGVRKWYRVQHDTLIENGFNDPRTVGGGEPVTFENDPSTVSGEIVFRGTVYAE